MPASKSGLGTPGLDWVGEKRKATRKKGTKKTSPKAKPAELLQANFLITAEQRRRLLIYGANKDMKPSEVVRLALDRFFAKETRKQGR